MSQHLNTSSHTSKPGRSFNMAEFLENVTERSPQLQDIEGLPPSVNIYHYNGGGDFHRRLSFERSRSFHPGVVVFMIEPSDFERDFIDGSIAEASHVRIYFNAETNVLTAKMIHPIHEHVISYFEITMSQLAAPMEMKRAVRFWGSGTLRDQLGSAKEADGGWGPRTRPYNIRGAPRPRVVLEVGWSETAAKLRRDCQYWVDPQRGQAVLAIGMKIHRNERKISITKYQWNPRPARPRAEEISTLEIKKRDGQILFVPANPAPQLEIPFHTLFGRNPQPPREQAITFNTQELTEFAENIWDLMELDSIFV